MRIKRFRRRKKSKGERFLRVRTYTQEAGMHFERNCRGFSEQTRDIFIAHDSLMRAREKTLVLRPILRNTKNKQTFNKFFVVSQIDAK